MNRDNKLFCLFGILAQLGEHLPYKQRVTGSSPVGPITTKVVIRLICRRGGTGRRPGLKIPWVAIPVPVRFRSPALLITLISYVRLAQLDRAFGYGPKGRGFESSNARD